MSHSSVFEWACIPAGPTDTLNTRTPTCTLHTFYAALLRLHKIQISSLNVCFHPTLLCSVSPLVHPCARIYIGRNDIVEVIEKLSCRSGWFVEPVRALIHPAASPHKKNIKQAIPEERRQRRGRWKERQREREREWTQMCQQQKTRAKNGRGGEQMEGN